MGKRVWIVSEVFPPDETATGYIMGEIANALSTEYEVGVICGSERYDEEKADFGNKRACGHSITIHRATTSSPNKNSALSRMRSMLSVAISMHRLASRLIQPDDKVLLATNPPPLLPFMARLRKRRRFQLIVLVHDIFPENTKAAGFKMPAFAYGFLKKIFDKAYASADKLIAIGRDMKKVLLDKIRGYVNKPKIEIIENWAEIDEIAPSSFCFNNPYITIQYAGNIGRVQGLERFVTIFKRAQNNGLRLDFWGTGAIQNSLKKECSGHDCISFNGAYARAQQPMVLNACDLALVTLADGMLGLGVPSKAYNIMAAGKPILYIGDEQSELAMCIREERLGYAFTPQDADGLLAFLKSITIEKRSEFSKIGARCRHIAETKYSRRKILEKFLKI